MPFTIPNFEEITTQNPINKIAQLRRIQAKKESGVVTENDRQREEIETRKQKARKEEEYLQESDKIKSKPVPILGDLDEAQEFAVYSTPGMATIKFADDASKAYQGLKNDIKYGQVIPAIGHALQIPSSLIMGAASVIPVGGILQGAKNETSKFLDNRFQNVILPEHYKGVEFLNKEVIPARFGRKFTEKELARTLNKDVDRYRFFGPNRTDLFHWGMTAGYADWDGKIRYNPLFPKKEYAPIAVHEGTHQLQMRKPSYTRHGLVEKNPYTGSFEEIDAPIFYTKRITSSNGEVLPINSRFDPHTGESLYREFNPKTDLKFTIDKDGNIQKRFKVNDNEKLIDYFPYSNDEYVDLHRRSIQHRAFPIRQFERTKIHLSPFTFNTANNSMERDATTIESLYKLSRNHNGVLGKGLDYQIKNASNRELYKILNNGGYGDDYLLNWGVNRLFGVKPPVNEFRQAMLMRNHGGKLNYLNYIN